ncbi:MAG: hypothetical protein DMD69_03275 [Gemmatimonadetes bacterium]|nr:MAG: hypothetical protein DMD69_03275 [Gemmatimonadota bacterium]
MLPHLHLSTLGAPLLLLTATGEQIRFRTRKHFALLIRLAVEAGRRFTRDYLMDLLWGDAAAHLARHSLAQALTVLKEKVGREHLVVQRATVALAEGAVDADVAHLDACDLQIRGAFLDGFEVPAAAGFEQWKDEWRARLGPRIRDCLVKQMDAGRRIGDFATVERHAQVLHELDPLSEDAVRGLMEARAWVGDRTNALKAYARFEERLREELGAKPSTDLVRVADLLRQGRRPAPRPDEGARAGRPAAVSERQERRFEAETLIGREQPFAKLYDAWLEVRRRVPRIVVLTGDPGIGKTTLTNAFVSTCQMEGAVVARAQAYDAERELPFAILAELVKQLTLQRAIGGAEPEALSELSRVSPELFNVFPGVPKPVEWSAEVIPLRLAGAFLKAVEAATDESPLVLVVDDIHAADNASAAILHMVARKLSRTRLLLILTGRTNELRTAAAPSALVSDTTVEALQTLELEPLSAEAAERLVGTLAAQAESKIADLPTTRILQAGNGNPLALELLTKEWVAHGSGSLLSDIEALNTQPVANLGIPRAIGAVFERQIRRLDATSRAALDLAAVLGRRLADLPLYTVVGLSPAGAGEALTRLLEEGFLREVHGTLEFRNELIRAQAYYAVAGPARQHLHRGIGEMLAARRQEGPQRAELELAWHFLSGDQLSEAVTHGIAGADDALRVGAPYEAERILKVLLRKSVPESSRSRVRLMLTKALLDQSKAEAALPMVDALTSEGGLLPRETAEVARMKATSLYLINRDTGRSHLAAADEALGAAKRVNDVELVARALFEYARAGAEAGDEERVRDAQVQIDQVLSMNPSAREIPVLHYALGFCHYFFFEPQAAAASLEVAKELLAATSNSTELSFTYNGYANCKTHLGEFDEARLSYLAALDLARKIGDDSRASIITGNLCGLLTMMGDYLSATEFGLRSVEFGKRALSQPALAGCFTSLAEAYTLAGDAARASECLQCADDWVRKERRWSANVDYLCQRACTALLTANLGLALTLIGRAEEMAWGRERTVPNPGVFEKLRILRATHVSGPDEALRIASEAKARFRGRHPLYHLTVVVAAAWLERRTIGSLSPEAQAGLQALEAPRLAGLRALNAAQGFLS